MYKSVLRLSVIAAFLALAGAANAGFNGPFDLANWTFQNSAGNDGYVILSAPDGFGLAGGDNGMALGTADFTIVVPGNFRVSFDWYYDTEDALTFAPDCSAIPGDYCDPAYLIVNGVETQLSFSAPDTGSEVLDLYAGDVFGFRVKTADGLFGRGGIAVGHFTFVPEPATIALFGLGLAFLGLGRPRKA